MLFQSMLLVNPGALQEQRASGDHQSRPGDLYHPQSCPAYFDVSVLNTLAPSIISRASVSTRAAAAAAAGEALKDKCHEDNVIAAKGIFCPLIVETF